MNSLVVLSIHSGLSDSLAKGVGFIYQANTTMSLLDDAKMPSLKDKIRQESEVKEELLGETLDETSDDETDDVTKVVIKRKKRT